MKNLEEMLNEISNVQFTETDEQFYFMSGVLLHHFAYGNKIEKSANVDTILFNRGKSKFVKRSIVKLIELFPDSIILNGQVHDLLGKYLGYFPKVEKREFYDRKLDDYFMLGYMSGLRLI